MAFTYSADGKELSIDTPEPPRRFDNMIYNRTYMSMIDQCARGNSKHMTDEGWTNNVVAGARIIYIRDNETGEYFSVGHAPVWKKCDSYRCTSGFNYQVYENVTDELRATWRVYVPAGDDPIEVWDLRIENLGGRARKLSVFTAVEMNCDGVDTYGGSLFRLAKYEPDINAIFVLADAERFDEINFPNHNGFLTADRKAVAWDANQEKFIGPHRTLSNPLTVEVGKCENRIASMWTPTTTLQFDIAMAAGAAEDTRMLMGACDHQPMIAALRERYLGGNLDADPHFDALARERADMMRNIQVDTPDQAINRIINLWVKQQVHYGATWVRWGYKGYRDMVQQSQGVLTQDPRLARESLTKSCRHQYTDGFALRGWHPLDTMRYADSAQWLISAITEYAKETGDLDYLSEVVPYLDEGEGTVYEHLMKAMIRLHTDRGPRGMCLAFFGDWNDSLTAVCRKGKGESVWLSMAFCRCAVLMVGLAERLGKVDDAKRMRDWHAEVSKAINDNAWDGQWYLCAIDDDGNPIGSHSNDEGKIFLNMQSWAQMGRVATDERFDKAWSSVKKHLDSGWGLTLNWPTYTKPQANIGRLSYLRPGICENGSVYTHGNAFMMLALLERGQADDALNVWRGILPGNTARPVPTQPNVFINGFLGPDSDIAPGTAEHAWVTGSASWMFQNVVEYMLGVRRTYDGLFVCPCMPSEWKTASIRRIFRGTTYDIRIDNPGGKCAPAVADITVDGETYAADKPLPIDGNEHKVVVTLAG